MAFIFDRELNILIGFDRLDSYKCLCREKAVIGQMLKNEQEVSKI